jgi:hypothetical protein
VSHRENEDMAEIGQSVEKIFVSFLQDQNGDIQVHIVLNG